jgi:hypothetical protein
MTQITKDTLIEQARKWQPPKKLQAIERDLHHGWLLSYVLDIDTILWGRWDYWAETAFFQKLPDRPIPQISWVHGDDTSSIGYKHLSQCLNAITNCNDWQGWGSWTHMDYFLDWLLFGLGHSGNPKLPKENNDQRGASMRLYQIFNVGILQCLPCDYFGTILADNEYGRSQGFYPTPECVVEMMVKMTMSGEDYRAKSVCDCCVGTGRMLLHASNHSMRLYGQDINATVIKATLINGYLYAPWMVRPLRFLDAQNTDPAMSEQVSDALTIADDRLDVAEYLADSMHDTEEQYKFEPIKKRRKNGAKPNIEQEAMQGLLF